MPFLWNKQKQGETKSGQLENTSSGIIHSKHQKQNQR